MADKGSAPRAHVFNVPLGNDLCDVTAQWILQSAGAAPLAICNNILLLPNNRAIKALTEAFVRQAAPGMLLPHMVAVGDMQLDEALGPMLDPIAASGAIWPAIASFERLMLLAKLIKDYQPGDAPLSSAEALRLARKLAELIDALEVDLIDFSQIAATEPESKELAGHWQNAYARLLQILPAYRAALTARKLMGPAERRNHLLAALEQRLAQNVDTGPVIAVGITTSAKAVARVLRRVARMPNGHVILPGVDLNLSDARWDDLSPPTEDSPGFARRRNVEVHPQFHLKHLLELMGIDRSEIDVLPTARTEPESATISEIFCLPEQSIYWQDLPPLRKSLPNAKWLEAEDSAQEAKAIAVRIRGALEVAGKRVALITPDRELAVRVAGQLHRWGIEVDDSAGIPLLQTPPGTLALALVDAIWSRFSASSILAIAKHPLVFAGTQRLAWLDHVRQLDLALRGTASGIGLSAITRRLQTARKPNTDLIAWWSGVATQLAPLEMADGKPFEDVLASLRDVATVLTDGGIWRGASGRELTRNWEDVTASDLSTLGRVDATGVVATFREIFPARLCVHHMAGTRASRFTVCWKRACSRQIM